MPCRACPLPPIPTTTTTTTTPNNNCSHYYNYDRKKKGGGTVDHAERVAGDRPCLGMVHCWGLAFLSGVSGARSTWREWSMAVSPFGFICGKGDWLSLCQRPVRTERTPLFLGREK